MKQIKITIVDVSPKLKKGGEPIIGDNWQLFQVNGKYDYFHHGEGSPKFTVGTEYTFDLEEKESGQYTNYLISIPKNMEVMRPGDRDFHEEAVMPIGDLKPILEGIERLKVGQKIINDNIQILLAGKKKEELPIIED